MSDEEAARLQVRPLPGARELLAFLPRAGVPWAIATSGRLESARPVLALLELAPAVPVITRDRWNMPSPTPTCSSRRSGSWA